MNTEEWRPIPSAPGYEASSLGRIRSLLSGQPRIMRPARTHDGRPVLNVARPWPRRIKVHIMVAEAFHGPRPPGLEIRHLDGERTNNAATNLRYGTRAENERDKVLHGAHGEASKTHCPRGHLYSEGNTYSEVRPDGRRRRHCRTCRAAYMSAFRSMTPEQRAERKAAGLPLVDLTSLFATERRRGESAA